MIISDSSSAYAGSNQVRTIASFGSNLYNFITYADTTLSRIVSGSGIGILKNGSGTLTLSAANTYTGNATISAGVMSIINTGALAGYNVNGRFAVAPNATLAVYNAVTDAEITTLLNTTNFKPNSYLGFDTTSGNRTYTPAIGNTSQGALGVTKLGQNTLIIPTAGTYTGTTSVLVGTLSTFGANIIPDSSPVFLDTNGTLVLGGSDTLATISGRGTLNCQANNITLNSNNNSTFLGTLTSTANSGSCIYKQGNNTITLSGATVRVAGPIRLDTGGMTLAGNTSFIQNRTSGGPRDFQMALNAANTFNLTISGGASLTTTGCMFGENNGGSAAVNLLSGGTWNSGSGGGSSWMAGLSSILNIDGGAYSALNFYIGGGTAGTTSIINLNSGTANLTGGTFIWQGAGRCVFNLNGGTVTFGNMSNGAVTDNTFNFNGGTFACAVGSYNYNVAVVKYIVKSGGAIFNPPAGATITLTTSVLSADSVSTGGGLVKNGAGTLSLGGVLNTFTGQVSANEGTISISTINNNSANGPFGNSTLPIVLGSNGKSGSLSYTGSTATSNKPFTLASGGTGIIDVTTAATTYTSTGIIDGSGMFVKNGAGTLTLSANNTFSGNSVLNAGALKIASDSALGTGNNINLNGAQISSDTTASRTLSNNTVSLSSDTTFPTVASEKSLTFTGTTTMFGSTRTLTVQTGSTVTSEYINFAGPIGDNGNGYGLIKAGNGTLVLSGNNTYSGNTTINAGNLRMLYLPVGEIRFGSGNLQYGTGITADLSSKIRNNTNAVRVDTNGQTVVFDSLSSSNTGGLVKTGTGTLILTGSNNTYMSNNGTTISNGGTLTYAGTHRTPAIINISNAASITTGVITISGSLTQTATPFGTRSFSIAEASNAIGTLNIVSGATLELSGGMMMGGNTISPTGILNVYGGSINTRGQFWPCGNSIINMYNGTLDTSGNTLYLGGGGTAPFTSMTSTLNISGGTLTCSEYNLGIGQLSALNTVTNLVGGTLSIGYITNNSRPLNTHTFYFDGGTLNIRTNFGIPSTGLVFSVKSGGAIFDIPNSITQIIPTVFANGGGGGGFRKLGLGRIILQGANAYTGPTVVESGTLELSGSSATLGGATSTVISVSGGATLDLANKTKTVSNVNILSGGIVKNAGLVLSNATVNIGSSTSLNNVYLYNSATSTLNNTSGSTIVLDSTNSFDHVSSTLILSGSNIDAGSCVTNFSGGANSNPSINVNSSTFTIGRVNASQVNRVFTKNGNGTLRFANIDNTSTWLRTQTTALAAGTLEIHDGRNLGAPIATTSYYLRIDGNSTLRFINSSYSTWPINPYTSYSVSILSLGTTLSADVSNADFAMFTGITGGGALCKVGSGKLIFTAANAYGSTIINSGTLELSASGTLGFAGGVNQPLTMNGGILNLGTKSQGVAALTVNGGTIQNGTLTMSSNLSGSITGGTVTAVVGGTNAWLIKSGTGIATLSAINTYTGQTSITDGTLRVLKKISGTGSDVSFSQADFTPTTLTVTFNSGTPPSVGNTFKLFSGATLQTYSSVALINYSGTASYNSTNSTLTINS